MQDQLRTAIVVSKALSPGEVANGVAVVMGQLAQMRREIYGAHDLVDADGIVHASISYNVVILTGRQGQIMKSTQLAKELGLNYCVFGNKGRGLSNNFPEYVELVQSSPSDSLDIIVTGMTGNDETVRTATKGLSLYSPTVSPAG